jgi:hypothetical protein
MKPFLCVPKGIINSELIKLVMLRLEDDDELRQLNQNVAVATALSDAYPCR